MALPNPEVPPPKTDKPRPHTCTTCSRAFARLEHLKRHERSHTKEKPFECPECSRCFARRDLLLRHQQKLHMTTTPSSRPRNARRESTSAAGPTRVRKNSIAQSGANSMRPRANTISHVETSRIDMMTAGNPPVARTPQQPTHAHHPSLGSMQSYAGVDFRGLGEGNSHPISNLTKIDTSAFPLEASNGLRTAPPFGPFNTDLGYGDFVGQENSTINPAQLHFAGSPHGFASEMSSSPFDRTFPTVTGPQNVLEDDHNYDWVHGFDNSMTLANTNESAIDGSSPSAMSTGSVSGVSEVMMDGSNPVTTSAATNWTNPMLVQSQGASNQFPMDFGSTFPDLGPQPETVSPKNLLAQNQFADTSFSTAPPMTSMSASVLSGVPTIFHPPMVANGDPIGASGGSIGNSNYVPKPASSSPIESITDSARQLILNALQIPSGFNNHRFSQSSANISMSPTGMHSSQQHTFGNGFSFPSTEDLRRFVSAYISYFHPHMPFIHISTLDFGAPEYATRLNASNGDANFSRVTGGSCLILSMAAIGALYEFETVTSKELFESAKTMIQLYLEERRRADMSAAINRSNSPREGSIQNTPLWLVQSMLLNVVYGHNSGDKTATDIANTHCAALVSLAKAAGLLNSIPVDRLNLGHLGYALPNVDSQVNGANSHTWHDNQDPANVEQDWLRWKVTEERKRTLFAIFSLSSLLVSAYNQQPALVNSEIHLDLPCDEQLWSADSSQTWKALGGCVNKKGILFSTALATLLTANKRRSVTSQHPQFGNSLATEEILESDLKPSTYGCLVLIHALHNYIWDTRERHVAQQWTAHDMEVMHAKIEPALRAWQSAWSSNPCHSLERPNPYGLGPLSADSIPLLDLAYVRLFVNLGRSKEAFWQRDWNNLTENVNSHELSQDSHFRPGYDLSGSSSFDTVLPTSSAQDALSGSNQGQGLPDSNQPIGASTRERFLRKAAFYAADSISMSDKLGNTYAEFTSRELPIQSAMCAFDCAQVLAEWITIVQERVGPYLGILGQDIMDLNQVPAILLLEDEDYKLMQKIEEILRTVEQKMQVALPINGHSGSDPSSRFPSMVEGGYGIKILFSTAYLLDRAAVWPGKITLKYQPGSQLLANLLTFFGNCSHK